MMSDGKRMRAIWRPGDGDGDSTRRVFERNKATIRGHPTWKIFTDEIPTSFTRGSKEEPPHYVYLDDAACYIIYKSGKYTVEELREFWPFDFDHQGNVKTGRSNRGRPAWADGSVVGVAKGKLRGNKWYDFAGAPETSEYKPLRPGSLTKTEREVYDEWAARKNGNAQMTNTIEGSLSVAGSILHGENSPEDTFDTNNEVQSVESRAARLERVSALRSSPPRYPPPPVPQQSQTLERPPPLQTVRRPSSDPKPCIHSVPDPAPIPKRKRGPFLDSSSSASESPPVSKRARLDNRCVSLPDTRNEILPDHQGGEYRSNSLPFELPETVPDDGSDSSSEDDEFLRNIRKAFGKSS